MLSATHRTANAVMLRIAIILTFNLLQTSVASAEDAPANLMKRVAEREAINEEARSHYLYRQTVSVQELDSRGAMRGEYREAREIIFSPKGERLEQPAGKPSNTLVNLKMTEEDFRDVREVQSLLLTPEVLFLYESVFRGEEQMDGVDCWVVSVRPRQILYNQRLFEGMLWVDRQDFSIVRMEGRAVPQKLSKTGQENHFPRFTTIRERVNGFRFPKLTYGDDTLPFRTGPQRLRLTIRYADYKKFEAESRLVP